MKLKEAEKVTHQLQRCPVCRGRSPSLIAISAMASGCETGGTTLAPDLGLTKARKKQCLAPRLGDSVKHKRIQASENTAVGPPYQPEPYLIPKLPERDG